MHGVDQPLPLTTNSRRKAAQGQPGQGRKPSFRSSSRNTSEGSEPFCREQNESAPRTSGDRYEAGESDNEDSDGYQINAETSATHNWDAKLPYCTTRGIRERALESGR